MCKYVFDLTAFFLPPKKKKIKQTKKKKLKAQLLRYQLHKNKKKSRFHMIFHTEVVK